MKVLILSQHFWPETFRINEVAESLQRAGCDITVLTGQPNYPDGKIFDGYRASATARQAHAGYTIYRVPLVPRRRGTARQLLCNYASFLIAASTLGPWMLRGQRFDVIFVYGTSPILQAIPGIVLRLFKRAALVTWVQDLWPQSLEVTGFVRSRHLLAVVAFAVRWIYRKSDLLLAQSQAFVPTIKAMAGNTRVEYHPHPGELEFDEVTHPGQTTALNLDSGFNVVFAGNLGSVQALDTILGAAERLLTHISIRVWLIGSGSRSAWLAEEVSRRRLFNIRIPGRFPGDAMPSIFSQASALLVSLVRSPIMTQTIPGKIQAYFAAGRPIIAALDGEGARVVREAAAGVTCPAEDEQALAEAILYLKGLPEKELRLMGDSGRRYYKTHFDPAVLADRLVSHFDVTVGQFRRSGSASRDV